MENLATPAAEPTAAATAGGWVINCSLQNPGTSKRHTEDEVIAAGKVWVAMRRSRNEPIPLTMLNKSGTVLDIKAPVFCFYGAYEVDVKVATSMLTELLEVLTNALGNTAGELFVGGEWILSVPLKEGGSLLH